MWRTLTSPPTVSFKCQQASPTGGQLAKAIDDPHQQAEVSNALVSINSIYCVNGLLNDVPTNFLVDLGAAISVVHYNLVKGSHITKQGGLAVGALKCCWTSSCYCNTGKFYC